MSAPVYNVSVGGNSNETDLVIQSAGASIVEHDNHDHTLVNKNSADIGKLESAVYGPPEFVKLNEKIKSIKPGTRNAISGDGKTVAYRILDKSSINSISAIIEIRSEDSSKDATLDLGELPLENGTLFGSDVREIYFDDNGNTLILGDSAGALTDGNTGQTYLAGRVIIFSFDSVLKQWKNTLNYIGTNPNVTNNTFLSVGWSVSMSGDGKTAVAFSVDFTEPYPGIDQNDLRIWKNINNEWVLQVVEQPNSGLIGFAGCVAMDKQGENIVLFNRSTEVMYIFSPVNDVWKVKYSESFSNLFTGDSNPWLSYLGRIPPTIVTMEDHYRILCGIGEDYMYVFQLLKSASSGPVSAFTKIPHLGYSAQMSANSERLAIGELGYGNYRGRTTVYNLTYDKGIIVSNLIYRIDGEIGNQIVNDLGGLLSTESGYMVSIDNEGKRMVANSKYKPSSNVQQVYLIDEPKLDKVYKTLLQSTQLNEKTLVVHEGLVTKNIADISANVTAIALNVADISANVARLDVHEGLVTQNIKSVDYVTGQCVCNIGYDIFKLNNYSIPNYGYIVIQAYRPPVGVDLDALKQNNDYFVSRLGQQNGNITALWQYASTTDIGYGNAKNEDYNFFIMHCWESLEDWLEMFITSNNGDGGLDENGNYPSDSGFMATYPVQNFQFSSEIATRRFYRGSIDMFKNILRSKSGTLRSYLKYDTIRTTQYANALANANNDLYDSTFEEIFADNSKTVAAVNTINIIV